MEPIILDETMFLSKNTATCKWCLSDDEISRIRQCSQNETVKSKMFTMHRLQFQIWLYVCYAFLESHESLHNYDIYSQMVMISWRLDSVILGFICSCHRI